MFVPYKKKMRVTALSKIKQPCVHVYVEALVPLVTI